MDAKTRAEAVLCVAYKILNRRWAARTPPPGLDGLLAGLCRLYGARELPRFCWAPGAPRPRPVLPFPLERPENADLEYFLHLLLAEAQFRPGQREAVCRLLRGEDLMLVLPTGAGKSAVFQLASMLLPGTCLVVEPTASLIHDQSRHLARRGIDRVLAFSYGDSAPRESGLALERMARGEAWFCYVSPERLGIREFRAALRRLALGSGLNLAVFDEAHCVSEWGHDFRPAYLAAGRTLRRRGSAPGRRLPVAALSATMSGEVQEDVRESLGLEIKGPAGAGGPCALRKELSFHALRCAPAEKSAALRGLLSRDIPALWPDGRAPLSRPRGRKSLCGIVFCPHVEGPFGARRTAEELRTLAGLPVDVYHGRARAGATPEAWASSRREAAARFESDRVALLCATKAYGIGIDKPNIRYTVHYSIPASVEAFLQEAGRAGRDGAPAHSWILASIGDEARALRLIDPDRPSALVAAEAHALARRERDDVALALSFHFQAFRGAAREAEDVRQVALRLGDLSRPGTRLLALPCQHQAAVEKALYRMQRIGAVADYAVRFRERAFEVEVPEGAGYSSNGQMLEAARASIEETYATIERSRRRSLRGMVLACLGRPYSPSPGPAMDVRAWKNSSAFSALSASVFGFLGA